MLSSTLTSWTSLSTATSTLYSMIIPLSMTILAIILVHIGLLTYHHKSKKYLPDITSGRDAHPPTHLLIVLGSGGHTAEMISMLKHAPLDPDLYTYRTYVVSSGDSFSARKAVEFEEYLLNASVPKKSKEEEEEEGKNKESHGKDNNTSPTTSTTSTKIPPQPYTIITVPRARKVHQSLLTAPISTLHCLWACLLVLQGKHPDQKHHPPITTTTTTTTHNKYPGYPDLILTNGPATAVCIILAATIIRTLNRIFPYLQQQQQRYHPTSISTSTTPHAPGTRYLRTIFIESWARVTTLSLSGKLVLPLVDRFLVQWEGLEGYSYSYYSFFAGWMGGGGERERGRGRAEYVGALVG
ncbi:UDP-N-acetylglucosamine transferase subunit [Emmonsiellopsis sp. PD_33]|nr:UDP-N-acetylglucosamine transferase subunit [Emmonsiellopsis sp. PD_33]